MANTTVGVEEEFLADIDWVLRDISGFEDGGAVGPWARYWRYLSFHRGEFIEKEIEAVAENAHWMLYKRIPG